MVRIRVATAVDARAIAHVKVEGWRAAYRGIVPEAVLAGLSVDAIEREWAPGLAETDGPMSAFVTEDANGQIAGFASCGPRRDGPEEYEGELYAIYLLPEAQGRGAGRELVRTVARRLAERGMRSMLLWVFEENAPARRFYERMGGALVGRQGFELGGKWMVEVAYGWENTAKLPGE